MTPWFSLILPCYNVERYVGCCVQSILSQNYSDYEIILVNDGSTDQTLARCNEMAEKHSCIRVIDKANGGLSSARNAGMEVAQGKYIWFIDSDDWIEPNALLQLYQACVDGETDIIKFAYCRVETEKNNVPLNVEAGLYLGDQQIETLRRKAFCEAGRYCLSAWSHIYKRCFLEKYQLRFVSERLVGSEDYLFNLQAMLHAYSLRVLPTALYVYEFRTGSLTQTYKPDLMERYSELCRRLKQYYRDAGACVGSEKLIDRFFVWHLAIGTAMMQEYMMLTAKKNKKLVRKAVRAILNRTDVQDAVKNGDQTGMRWQKKLQCYGIRLRIEGLFFWLYVEKPRLLQEGKRLERE